MATENASFLTAGLGLVFTLVGYFKGKEIKKIKESGIKAEGVVFSLEFENSSFNNGSDYDTSRSPGMYYPVIRYVTAEKEWVTEKYNIGSYPSKYQEGDKVPVIYDPENIKEFIIDNNSVNIIQHAFWFGIGLIAVGAVLFTILK